MPSFKAILGTKLVPDMAMREEKTMMRSPCDQVLWKLREYFSQMKSKISSNPKILTQPKKTHRTLM